MTEQRRRPTLRDIAIDTGLSTAAVSYALRGLQVPAQTQARVRAAADRLGYQVDPIARALSSGKTNNIGVLCGSLEDAWQQRVSAALGRGLLQAGRQALIVDAANDPAREASLARQLVDQRVDALISLPVDPKAGHWAAIADLTALISIGDALPGASTAAEVVFDNAAAVTDALTRLADAGHRDVTVLTAMSTGTPDRSAEAVVHQVAPTLKIRAVLRSAPHDLDGAAAVATSVLTGAAAPTAILCLADSIAYGVYLAARRLDLAIPDDLSVMGYDDQPVSRVLTPALSTYYWPIDQLTDSVVERTILAVDDGKRSRRKVIAPTAQIRESIGAPRRR